MAFHIHPHLADPDGDFFFTADVVDDAEFSGDERGSKRRRIEDLSQRYLKGEPLVIQSAKLRGALKTTHRRVREEPRKRGEVQQRVNGILKRERGVRPKQPSSPEVVPEKTPSTCKEATREWLRRLEPPAPSPEAEGDISRLEDRLGRLEHRTPSKPSHPPSIAKNPTVNHVLKKNNLKLCFKEKKKASKTSKTLASDSLLDLYDLDLSGKPTVRSHSQPTLTSIPSLQANVDDHSARKDLEAIEDGSDVEDLRGRENQTWDDSLKPAPTADIAQEQRTTDVPLSLQVNIDEDSVLRGSKSGNGEGGKVDSAQEGQTSGPPSPDVAQETPGRAPLTSRTTAIVSSPARKTFQVAVGQENLPCDGKTPKEPLTLRPQHSRTLSDPARHKEKVKKSHTLHASPTVFHSPFVYRKACDEEKLKAATTKGPRKRGAIARFVEFGSSPVHMDHEKPVEVVGEPQKPESGVEEIISIAGVSKDEAPNEDAPQDEAARHTAATGEAAADYTTTEEVPGDETHEETTEDAPKGECPDPPESLPFDFSTQAALITAQKAFQQQLVSPAKKSDIHNLLDPDPIFASQNTTPPPPGSPPTFSPITPFRYVNQEECKPSEKSAAPPVSTQELFNAATPFAFSTVKKQKPRKNVTIGIPSLLNPNPKPSGIASLLNPKNISPTFTPTHGKPRGQIKSTSPTFASLDGKPPSVLKATSLTFAPVNGKLQNQHESTSRGFTPVNGQPQGEPKCISPRWTPINSQSVSPRWTPINAKRDDTTIADFTGEIVTGTPAVSPSQRRKSRKRSSPLSVRVVAPAPKHAPSGLTSALSSQPTPSSTAPAAVSDLSQSQPQARSTNTPSPSMHVRHRTVSPPATTSALLSTSGTRPGHSTMLPELPDAQQRSGALLGDDEDVDIDAVVEDADSFLSTWDWRKELGSVGA